MNEWEFKMWMCMWGTFKLNYYRATITNRKIKRRRRNEINPTTIDFTRYTTNWKAYLYFALVTFGLKEIGLSLYISIILYNLFYFVWNDNNTHTTPHHTDGAEKVWIANFIIKFVCDWLMCEGQREKDS